MVYEYETVGRIRALNNMILNYNATYFDTVCYAVAYKRVDHFCQEVLRSDVFVGSFVRSLTSSDWPKEQTKSMYLGHVAAVVHRQWLQPGP